MAVIKDQKRFFDLNFRKRKLHSNGTFADFYSEEIARNGFKWLKDEKKILDYGCGDGASIDFYLDATKNSKVKIIGVDISGEAIKHVKIKYPQYRFYQIVHNTIPQIRDCSLDAVYLSHILHHAENHKEIFNEINKKLKKGGKLFICDLAAYNPIINISRIIFSNAPMFIKNKFNDDLVVDGDIPHKHHVDIGKTISILKKSGFDIKEINHKHLFLFIFFWINTIFGINEVKFPLYLLFLKRVYSLESSLLKYNFFKTKAHMFSIKCIKYK